MNITAMRNESNGNHLSQTIHAKTRTLETSLLRQNSQMRGFLVTADLTYLKSYNEARQEYDSASAELDALLTEPALHTALLKSRAATLDWPRESAHEIRGSMDAAFESSATSRIRCRS